MRRRGPGSPRVRSHRASRPKLCARKLTLASIPEAGASNTPPATVGDTAIGVQVPRRDPPRFPIRSGSNSRFRRDGNLPANAWHLCRIVAAFEPSTGIFRTNSRYFPMKREFAVGDWFVEDCVLSQPPRSLSGDLLLFAKRPHFRRLAVRSPVSGQESGRLLTESLDPGGVSLLAKFSISEICARERPETGCVSAETGSNLAYWGLCAASTGCGGFLPCDPVAAEQVPRL
jgi:hypothetical protein